MRPWRTAASGAAALAVLAATIWAASGAPLPGNHSDLAEDTGPVIAIDRPWEAYPMAGVRGTVVERNGCLLIGEHDLVFWPHGTRWDEGTRAVVFEDGSSVRVGETFRGAGGEYGTEMDFSSLIGSTAGDAIRVCLAATHVDGVLVAVPDGSE